jgi:hypothetical protein
MNTASAGDALLAYYRAAGRNPVLVKTIKHKNGDVTRRWEFQDDTQKILSGEYTLVASPTGGPA